METVSLIETSMSDVDEFYRCRRKYDYHVMRGWIPRSTPRASMLGTAFHACLAAGYNAVREFDENYAKFANDENAWPENDESASAARALAFISAAQPMAYEVKYDRDGVALPMEKEDRELIEDMVLYWWENMGAADLKTLRRILAVEEPAYIQIGNYLIRNTFDLVASVVTQLSETEWYEESPVIFDHKTVGDVQMALDFLQKDTQTHSYYSAAWGKYGKPARFVHTFVNREVPPGFGHRSLLTATGKKRPEKTLAQMQDVNRYLRRESTPRSEDEIRSFLNGLVRKIQDIDRARTENYFPESPLKGNFPGCSGCAYTAPCTSEMFGNTVAPAAVELSYLIKGSEEWHALQTGKVVLEVK